jgi:hypothetical protein
MTVLAILGTFLLGFFLFDYLTGLLAATFYSFSPFVLHFGKDALTQGDAFAATTVVFALIAFDRFEARRNSLWLFVFSLLLAFALASKFFLVVLIPAFLCYQVISALRRRAGSRVVVHRPENGGGGRMSGSWRYVLLAMSTGLLTLLALAFSLGHLMRGQGAAGEPAATISRIIWGVSLLGILFCLLFAVLHTGLWPARKAESEVRWTLPGAWFAILPLAFAGTFSLFPAHIFNPRVLPVLLERFLTMDGGGSIFAATPASARVYLGILLLKLGLALGVVTLTALVWAVAGSTRSRPLLLLVSVLAFFGLLLAILPLHQPLWLMSVYPVFMVLLAAFFAMGLAARRSVWLRFSTATYLVVALIWLSVGVVRVYPFFGLYGYETTGDRWLGGEARGYREVVTVTNDGSTEAIDWLRDHVPEGSRVLNYLNDYHILAHLDRQDPFKFELMHAPIKPTTNGFPYVPDWGDFAVVRPIDDPVTSLSPENHPLFLRRFGAQPVFEVFRGRGDYRMPVIRVFQRAPVRTTRDEGALRMGRS